MSTLPLVIVNPASAGGATGRAWPSLASELRTHFGAFAVALTKRSGEAVEIAEREARTGRRFIIACGGDGTISEVANGILRASVDEGADSRAELGVLPSGTGGDFRRTLGTPTRAADAARALREGKTSAMDAGRVTLPATITGSAKTVRSATRSIVPSKVDLPETSGKKGFGRASVEAGHSRVPAPPTRMTGTIKCCLPADSRSADTMPASAASDKPAGAGDPRQPPEGPVAVLPPSPDPNGLDPAGSSPIPRHPTPHGLGQPRARGVAWNGARRRC